MNLLDLMVRIGVQDEASGAVQGIAGNIIGKLGSAAKKVAGLVAAAFAVRRVTEFGRAVLGAYASFEQLEGGVAKLYGNAGMSVEEYAASVGRSLDDVRAEYDRNAQAQQAMLEYAQEGWRTAGVDANTYLQTATSFSAALINSLGGDTARAAEMTDVAMRAISDNVNTFGSDMESVQYAFQGFAKQNYTMLDNLKLGYGGTKSEMERLIADANAWGAANGAASDLSIDSFADVVTAIQQIQQAQGIAGTTQAEAMGTIEGSANAAKSAWNNLVTELGKPDADIGARVEDLTKALFGEDGEGGLVRNVLQTLRGVASNVAKQLPSIAQEMFGTLGSEVSAVLSEQLGDLWPSVQESLSGAGDVLSGMFDDIAPAVQEAFATIQESLGGVFGDLSGVMGELAPVAASVGEALGPVLASAISVAAPVVATLASAFGHVAAAVGPVISKVGGKLADTVLPALNNALQAAQPFVDAFCVGFDAIMEALEPVGEAIGDQITPLFDGLAVVLDTVATVLDTVWAGLQGFMEFLNDPIGTIQRGFESIWTGADDASEKTKDAMDRLGKGVSDSMDVATKAIEGYNDTSLMDKRAEARVDGNAPEKETAATIDGTRAAISSLVGKTVTASVNGSAANGSAAGSIWNTKSAIDSLYNRNVTVQTTYLEKHVTTGKGGAWGGITPEVRPHATGGVKIADRYGAGVPLDVVGERGPEAIVPLTSRYGKDFATMMGAEAAKVMGGGNTINVNLYYDAGSDAPEMAYDVADVLGMLGAM
jgi:hypothetical protein